MHTSASSTTRPQVEASVGTELELGPTRQDTLMKLLKLLGGASTQNLEKLEEVQQTGGEEELPSLCEFDGDWKKHWSSQFAEGGKDPIKKYIRDKRTSKNKKKSSGFSMGTIQE